MQLCLENGALCLRDGDKTVLSALRVGIRRWGAHLNTLTSWCSGPWREDGGAFCCDGARIECRPAGQGILLRTYYTNGCDDLPSVDEFFALQGEMEEAPRRLMLNLPHNSNGLALGDMLSKCVTVTPQWGERDTSADYALSEGETQFRLWGFAGFDCYFGTVDFMGEGVVTFSHNLEKHPLQKGESLCSDWMYVSPAGEAAELLKGYGDLLAADVPTPLKPVPTGYCTWYYYLQDVSQKDVEENLEWLRAHKDRFPVRVIQIDDGWSDAVGDWNPNEKFDPPALAREIRDAGFLPGLWFNPFGAGAQSRVAREHPEYFVRKADGSLWQSRGRHCFDFSRPDAADYLRQTVRRFVSWGFGYFKMDLISDVLAPGAYADPHFNALRNYRRGLRLVREAAGEEAYLLCCTAPILASVGYADGMRVSGDVFDHWESTPRIYGRIFKRWWMDGRLFRNDPDCIILRTAAEEDGGCLRPCTRTERELQTFATACIAAGGALMLSDKMPLLREEHLRMLAACLGDRRAGEPLDLTESTVPGLVDLGLRDGVRTLAVMNWGDRERSFTLPGTAGHTLHEAWSGADYRPEEDLSLSLPPHGSALMEIRE